MALFWWSSERPLSELAHHCPGEWNARHSQKVIIRGWQLDPVSMLYIAGKLESPHFQWLTYRHTQRMGSAENVSVSEKTFAVHVFYAFEVRCFSSELCLAENVMLEVTENDNDKIILKGLGWQPALASSSTNRLLLFSAIGWTRQKIV